MIPRHLANAFRSGRSSFAAWNRAISLLKTTVGHPSGLTEVAPQKLNMSIISKRFFQSGSNNPGGGGGDKKSWSSWESNVFTGVGVFLGIGSGGVYCAYHGMQDKDTILTNYDLVVSCAKKMDDGSSEKDCIEKKCGDMLCLKNVECEEEIIRKANSELEKALMDIRAKAFEHTTAAMKAYCEATPIVCNYQNQAYCLINNDEMESPEYEESWCCIWQLALKRYVKVKDAMEKGQCAWALLCRLRDTIERGKECRYTSCNPLLVTAEESLLCAEEELLNEKAKMDWSRSKHPMVEEYLPYIEKFKQELQRKVDNKIADGEIPCEIKFPEQLMALIIAEAYGAVMRTHKEVAMHLVCTGRVPERLQPTCC